MKRSLLVAVALMALAPVAWAGRSTPAPQNARAALKILRADVTKIARDYRHKHYHAVCSDLTRKERKHLGGMSQCTLKIAVLNAFVPIKKFTITTAKLARNHAHATVSVYVNGNRKHLAHAVVKWERGQYRLDRETGWHPTL